MAGKADDPVVPLFDGWREEDESLRERWENTGGWGSDSFIRRAEVDVLGRAQAGARER